MRAATVAAVLVVRQPVADPGRPGGVVQHLALRADVVRGVDADLAVEPLVGQQETLLEPAVLELLVPPAYAVAAVGDVLVTQVEVQRATAPGPPSRGSRRPRRSRMVRRLVEQHVVVVAPGLLPPALEPRASSSCRRWWTARSRTGPSRPRTGSSGTSGRRRAGSRRHSKSRSGRRCPALHHLAPSARRSAGPRWCPTNMWWASSLSMNSQVRASGSNADSLSVPSWYLPSRSVK